MKRKSIIRWGIALLVILIVILAVARKQGWIGKEDATEVTIETAARLSIVETVSANGKIQPEIEVKLSPDVSGEVVELYVKEGDQVKTGDLLAKIDPKIYASNYDRLMAALNTQKANLANSMARVSQVKAQFINAESSFKRNETLFRQNAISASEYDAAKSAYEVAKAEVNAAEQSVKAAEYSVKSAEASLKEASENLYKTSIYAPVDGTISKLNVEKGERVAGASQFSSGTEILRIANLAVMEVIVSVNENDIVRVAINDTALVEVDSYLNRKFKGIITQIATSANVAGTSVDQVTNFDVKVRMLPSSYADLSIEGQAAASPFRPGMSATVDIQTERADNILAVPIQAVTTRSDSTLNLQKSAEKKDDDNLSTSVEGTLVSEGTSTPEYVFIEEGGIALMKRVKTGIQDNTHIQILEGIAEGDKVISGPYRAVSKTLKDGDKVEVVSKESLFNKK
ncbi:MAG: efflux RND transporter periplasmic adaptor subunit [Lentimicrobium sp.]|jgi:HlyD family secretion protein|nr:efflux RND transporter periplasmic adaptor subunit [Lentimicrobium sp.]MDD2527259.1 efflux RND transporter periplasmic adaptor subunit [Lentimicrobiaceae bacterium]MDD4596561.1 efflux RND transporter periplasmic adaptor subunit [Lentimicrobiaceae bacterium]MDY0024856.1 efflux RND transporter periplasmic adaptor subunit [Lentimicrobium sp.]